MPLRDPVLETGIFYHVFNRSVAGEDLFTSVDQYLYFIRLIQRKREHHPVDIVAYCLMPTHFHFLLISSQESISISKFMQGLSSSYAQSINRRLNRHGPLFAGRFKAIPVQEEPYFVHLARYIHRNPLEAGLVEMSTEWPFSNYQEVIGMVDGSLHDGSLVPSRFESGSAYRNFVEMRANEAPLGFEKYRIDE